MHRSAGPSSRKTPGINGRADAFVRSREYQTGALTSTKRPPQGAAFHTVDASFQMLQTPAFKSLQALVSKNFKKICPFA